MIILKRTGKAIKCLTALLLSALLAGAMFPGGPAAQSIAAEQESEAEARQEAENDEDTGIQTADTDTPDISEDGNVPDEEDGAAAEEQEVQDEQAGTEQETGGIPDEGNGAEQEDQETQENDQKPGGEDPDQNVEEPGISDESDAVMPGEGEIPEYPQGFSMTDPATGICAEAEEGVIPAGSFLVVTPLESGENYEMLEVLLSASLNQFRIYDISFYNMVSGLVEPNGNVRITVPVPEGYDTERLGVFHISTDGQKTEIPFIVEAGNVVFETDHFSLFAVAERKESIELPQSLPLTDKIEKVELTRRNAGTDTGLAYDGKISASEKLKSPATGDDSHAGVWAAAAGIAAVAAAAVIVIWIKKGRK